MSEQKNKNKKANPIVSYFKDVKAELKKVVWPTFSQVRNNTVIVLICIAIVAFIIAVLDLGFGASVGKVVEIAQDKKAQTEVVEDGTEADADTEDAGAAEDFFTDEEGNNVLEGITDDVQVDGEGNVVTGETDGE